MTMSDQEGLSRHLLPYVSRIGADRDARFFP
jgi:hypothetical protein